VCVIASGETTVRVRGAGRGGRNQEFALGMANALDEAVAGHGITALAASAGTDGIDGPTDAAGALVDSSTRARAARAGLDPADALARNDTYPFFQQLGDLIVWGPTGTNVGDVHVFLT
jgi:hydroxypyruvate reductase